MSLLHFAVLIGLLHNLCDVQAFTVEITQDDSSGFEGDTLDIRVRLEGQIFGFVDVELRLMTLTQFVNNGLAPPGFSLSEDPAESTDFSFDGVLTHRFNAVSALRQTTDFRIDIVDDDINERIEQFLVAVSVTNIQNEEEDIFAPENSARLFATVTIRVDPDNPDRSVLSIVPESGSTIVSESTTGWALLLNNTSFKPEHDIEISIRTQGSITNSATSSDYILTNTSVTLTSSHFHKFYKVFIEFVDDIIPEPELEYFEVIFEVTSGEEIVEFVTAASITLTIEDNDVLKIGFSSDTLTIREGESRMFDVSIIEPSDVDISVSVTLFRMDDGTAHDDELLDSSSFELSENNRQKEFLIEIPDNNEIDNDKERSFTLALEQHTTYSGYDLNISPDTLEVFIKDNDTDIEFGFIDTGPMLTVSEGESITFAVGFLKDNLQLDPDFVLGYSVIINFSGQYGNATSGDFESDEFIIYGVLTASSRTQSFTIETKSNELVEKNRKFTIGLLHTTATFNSPLVKASPNFSSITVIIEDNDIDGPNKPIVTVTPLSGEKQFEISWNLSITRTKPVNSITIEITYPETDKVASFEETVVESNPIITSATYDYVVGGVDYATENISVRVCATNNKGTTCSDIVYHQGVEVGRGGTSPDEGISGGAVAAIVIVLLMFCCVGIPLLLLILFLCRIYCWKTYYPVYREKKYEAEFANAREEFEDDV